MACTTCFVIPSFYDTSNILGINQWFLKFSDYFNSSIVIATLLNKAFVLTNPVETDVSIIIDDLPIEKGAVKRATSPRALKYNKQEYIVFPYYYDNGLKRYTEIEFSSKFPNAYAHLGKYNDGLLNRDVDNNIKWFEYGRNQALASILQDKLLISTVITNRVEVYRLDRDCVPYSGIYIRSNGQLPLDFAQELLRSEEFINYARKRGIYANGNSIRITASDIGEFEFYLPEGEFYGNA